MSPYDSMFSGVTGLTAQSRALETISNNITNINTAEFKANTNHFSTLVAPRNAGNTPGVSGVSYEPVPLFETQKFLQTTASPSSFALASGSNGFFYRNNLNDDWGLNNSIFTRAGHFAVDPANHLANASGHFLMGWKLNKDGEFVDENNNRIVPDPTADGDLLPIDLQQVPFTSRGTDTVHIKATFPAKMSVGDTFQASSRIFDDLSGAHVAEFNFTKADLIKLAGALPRLIDGASPAQGNDTFTISIATPANSILKDAAPVQFTALDLTFSFAGTDASGVTTWNVVATSDYGEPTSETAGAFSISFNSDDTLVDSALREIEMVWDDVLNAKNSIFALDFSDLTPVNDVEAAGVPDITSTVNEIGAVLKLDVESSDQLDVVVRGAETFVQFDNNGLLVTPDSIALEFDWSNTHSVAPNTDVMLELGVAGTAIGLTVSGNVFSLNSITQDGFGGSEIDHVLVGAGGRLTAVLNSGEEKVFSDGNVHDIRDLGIPLQDSSPAQPALSTPRETPVEEGATEHLQYSELGYMDPADMVSGPDRIIGSAQADSLQAMNNGGVVQGFDGDDLLYSGDGDDTLYGGTGDDTFYGLSGRDAYVGWLGNDTLDLHQHDAAVKIHLGNYVLSENGDRASLSGIESFIGTTFGDQIYVGNHPSGTVYGRSGNDRIYSDLYNDVLHGNSGSDYLQSGHGDDRLFGGSGNDFLNAGRGQDILFGGSGDDKVNGKNGDDELHGGSGNDRLWGVNNNDLMNGDDGDDRMNGGGGEDRMNGGAGFDRIYGGSGDDIISGGAGIDLLRGGIGADTFKMEGAFSVEKILDFTPGFDQIQFNSAGFEGQDSLIFKDFGGTLRITSADPAGQGNSVVLVGVALDQLGADDISF